MLVAEYIPLDSVYFIQTAYLPPPSRYDLRYGTQWNTCNIQLSRVNTIRFIHVLQPRKPMEFVPIPVPLVSKVGGFLGMFTDTCSTMIVFPKQDFVFGEDVAVRYEIDNSRCGKAVKEVKVKLIQRFTTRATLGQRVVIVTEQVVDEWRFAGCAQRLKVTQNNVVKFRTHG